MMNSSREIKDVFYLVALQGINYVMPLVVFPYLMAVLGAERFGYIGFSTALVQFFMLVVDFGFNFTATKEVALHKDHPEKLRTIFWNVFFAKIALLGVSFAVFCLVLFLVPRFAIYRTTALVFFLMVVSNAFSFVWYFQGLGKIRIISIANIISKLLILPLVFWLVRTPDDYLRAAFIQSGVYVFSALLICGMLFLGKLLPRWTRPTQGRVIAETRSAFPIFLSSTATSIYLALFAIILGLFSSPEDVGKYTAAEKIVRSFCYLIFIPVSQAFFPKISALSHEDFNQAVCLVKKIMLFVGGVMLALFFVLFFFSDYIVLLIGKDYDGIDIIFKIMAAIPLFVAVGGVMGQLGLLALGNERDKKHFQNIYFIAGGTALLSIFIAIPLWGSAGAAASLLLTELIVCILMTKYGVKLIKGKRS